MTRKEEIVNAAKEIIRQIEKWIANAHLEKSKRLPEHIVKCIHYAVSVCRSGYAPEECQQLCTIAVPKLGEETDQYLLGLDGSVQPGGLAGPMFWVAVRQIKELLFETEFEEVEQLEPVHALLAQKVSHEQIAKYIYGYRGEGPFMLKNGMVNYALVDKEAKEPGSVIPADWVHPSKISAVKKRREELAREVKVYQELEAGPKRYEDPQTIEEMLYAGAYVQQIEKGKNVTRQVVLDAAANIGVKPVDGPEYRRTMDVTTRPPAVEPSRQESPLANPASEPDSEYVRELIVAIHEGNPGFGNPEIIAALSEQGVAVSGQKIAAVLRAHKKSEELASAPNS